MRQTNVLLTTVMEGRLPADLKTFPLLPSPLIVYGFMMGDLDIQFVYHLDKFTPSYYCRYH